MVCLHIGMTFTGALVNVRRMKFGLVQAEKHVVDTPAEADKIIAAFKPVFPNLPVAMIALDADGFPLGQHGPAEVLDFLGSVDLTRVAWKKYNVNL
jgi:hypothetical protein